jgi:uncharacterized membrane protein YjjB (DUF3815 family)
MLQRARAVYREHADFFMFATLFVAFRVMTLLLFRPGGFIADYSDYNTSYLPFAQWSDRGLYPFVHYWLEWPPLFAWLVVGVYRLSLLIPQWADPRLWYNTLLGLSFLPFEVGNFVVIYLTGLDLYDRKKALRCALIYACLFAPLYVWSGWNDSVPLFFLLLSLYLLLRGKPLIAGMMTGIGFWVKVTPILIVPVGLRVLEGPRRKATFLAAVCASALIIALPFVWINLGFLWAFFANLLGRSSWETVWALLDGYYSYGVVTADRLTVPRDFSSHPSSLPWPIITAIFGLVLLWLYSRRLDYSDKLRTVALAALTISLFTLYSKGYSPQFIVQLIPFAVLLLPSLKGVSYIILLDVLNFLEATVYFIMLPDQRWLLVITVLLRTVLVLALSVEYGLILFDVKSPRVVRLHGRASAALLACVTVVLCLLIYPLGRAYIASRAQAEEDSPIVQVAPSEMPAAGQGVLGVEERISEGFWPLAQDLPCSGHLQLQARPLEDPLPPTNTGPSSEGCVHQSRMARQWRA